MSYVAPLSAAEHGADAAALNATAPGSVRPAVRATPSVSEILRSSALVGGASALAAMIGLLRVKAIALMLGPAGVGLLGAFTAIAELSRSLAGMGINSSGVRQIADSAGSGDAQRLARTVAVLRRTALVLGVLGAVLLALSARHVATLTFGDDHHWGAVALLSLAIFFRLVGDGQGAALQGLRRIGDIARLGVLGTLLGTLASIALIYRLREDGVAASVVVMAAASCLFSWWYSRKVPVEATIVDCRTLRPEAVALLRLGLAFMVSGLLTVGAAYLVRLILIRAGGLEAAGLYQAAWAVGGVYVTFVLQAMGTDFYPRLVAAANDNAESNRLVNEQMQVSLLLAGAGVIATLTFAPWVVAILYSEAFQAASDTLRWVCVGMALRVITWPLGYILVSKGRASLFIGADLVWTLANVLCTWWCVGRFGHVGAGIAFFTSYVLHVMVVYPITRRLSGFRWSRQVAQTAAVFALMVAAVHSGFLLLPPAPALALGVAVFVSCLAWTVPQLRELARSNGLPKKIVKVFGTRR